MFVKLDRLKFCKMECECGKKAVFFTNISNGECKVVCEKRVFNWDTGNKKSRDNVSCDMETVITEGKEKIIIMSEPVEIINNNYVQYFRNFNLKIAFFIKFKKLHQFDYIRSECMRLQLPIFSEFGKDIKKYSEYVFDLTGNNNKLKNYYTLKVENYDRILTELSDYILEIDNYTENKKTILSVEIDLINRVEKGYMIIIRKYPMLQNLTVSDRLDTHKENMYTKKKEYIHYRNLCGQILFDFSKAL
jgi:hypothetical protein